MSDTLLNLQAGTLPEGYCYPADPDAFQKLILGLAKAVFPGTMTGVSIGDSAPADLTTVWVRTDASNNIEGIYTYGSAGFWIRPHPVPVSSNVRQLWVGSEADLKTFDGGEDAAITSVGGPFWVVDHDFDYRCLMGPGTNATTYDGDAASSLAVGANAGAEQVQLAADELAQHRHAILTNDYVNAASIEAGTPLILSDTPFTGGATGVAYNSQYYPAADAKYHNNLPPVRGIFCIKRTARAYYRV